MWRSYSVAPKASISDGASLAIPGSGDRKEGTRKDRRRENVRIVDRMDYKIVD
jgi:hypothetical protein